MRRSASLLAAGTLAAGLASGAGAGPAGRPPLSHWLSWNAARHSARLLLVAGYDGTNGGFNFDGYARGRMLVQVPRGWLVTVACKNAGSRYHSCAVVRGAGSATIAFRGASSPHPAQGLAPGHSASFTFRASRTGVFRLVCLVPGHALAREYDVLKVVRSGRPHVEVLSSNPG
jgi:hypothetical protein